MQYGGMPSLTCLKDEESKNQCISGSIFPYLEIFFQDMKSEQLTHLKGLFYYIMNSIGQTFSKNDLPLLIDEVKGGDVVKEIMI